MKLLVVGASYSPEKKDVLMYISSHILKNDQHLHILRSNTCHVQIIQNKQNMPNFFEEDAL